jgi:hypothetical protein
MIGKVFKIFSKINPNLFYIDCTIGNLEDKITIYKNNYNYLNKKDGNKLFQLFDIYGTEDIEVRILKVYKVCDHRHLQSKQQLWINCYKKNCINNKNVLHLYL